MIYYIAHSDWILKQSRADIVKKLNDDLQITSICPLDENSKEIAEIYSSSIEWNISRTKLFDLIGVINLRKIIQELNKDDILHVFTIKTLFLLIISSLFFKKKFKVCVSITGLGYLFADTLLAKFIKIILRPFIILKINNLVDMIIFQNDKNQSDFIKYSKYNKKSNIISGSGLNTDAFIEKGDITLPVKVIFVGRLMREKGVREYIQIAELMQKNLNVEFFIAGEPDFGNKSSLNEKEFQELKNHNSIKYLGKINVYKDLKSFDVLIQPSYHEGFSRILLEATYAGLYTISNDIPGIKEIVEATNFGVLVKNNDVLAYVKEIEQFIQHLDVSGTEEAKKIIFKLFSVDAVSDQFSNIYHELI